MKNEAILSQNAPAPIGPYSQAVKTGNTIYCSGQIPLNSVDGSIPDGIEAQTKLALENLKAVLAAAGASPDCVVKTTVFLKDMNDFTEMNAVYSEFFNTPVPPARSTVQVAKLPKDVRVEIEAVAIVN